MLQIPTRTVVQIRTHAQKYFQKLQKDSSGLDGEFSSPPHGARHDTPGSTFGINLRARHSVTGTAVTSSTTSANTAAGDSGSQDTPRSQPSIPRTSVKRRRDLVDESAQDSRPSRALFAPTSSTCVVAILAVQICRQSPTLITVVFCYVCAVCTMARL